MGQRTSWNHNRHYAGLIVRSVGRRDRTLDLGCGDGWMSRALLTTSKCVVGVDSDPKVIALAVSLTAPGAQIEFVVGDMLEIAAERPADAAVAVASVHHVGARRAFEQLRLAVRPGGRVAVLGLYRPASVSDWLWTGAGLVASTMFRAIRKRTEGSGAIAAPRESFSEVKQSADTFLPGARLQRLLLFRYLLVWDRPA